MTSASQWKRCFTNPDSWTKWNIFSALFPGLELSGSLHPHIQGQPTPHLSVTHKEQEKKRGFSCKNVVALWACRVWQRKSQTPALPIYLTEVRGFSKDSSTRILSSCSLSRGNSPCLWFCRRESNKPFLQTQAGSVRQQKRPLKRQSGSHSTPCALARPGLGSSPSWEGNSTLSFFPMPKCWE